MIVFTPEQSQSLLYTALLALALLANQPQSAAIWQAQLENRRPMPYEPVVVYDDPHGSCDPFRPCSTGCSAGIVRNASKTIL